jgi:hypothetical protein
MGESRATVEGRTIEAYRPVRTGARGWLAAIPFALAWAVAAGALNGPVSPGVRCPDGPNGDPTLDAPCQDDETPAPTPRPPAVHREPQVFESNELISV